MTLRMGELFAGVGGLGMGVARVLDVELAWVSENEPAPSKILAHHHPDVPNLGDITTIDWSRVEPVDVLTGGSPCQDLSAAGKRVGMKSGTRSGLWASMLDAVVALRPRLVVWENVRGALSAEADSAVEPCAGCVGDGSTAALRALGRVVGDLANAGYVGRWCGLRASDVGAPHRRERLFVAAWPAADTDHSGRDGRSGAPGPRGWAEPAHRGGAAADTERRGRDGKRAREEPGSGVAAAADAERRRRDGRTREPVRGEVGRTSAAGDREDPAADTDGDAVREQPVTERRRGGEAQPGADAAPDTEGDRRDEGGSEPARVERGSDAAQRGHAAADAASQRRSGCEQPWQDMEQDGPEPAHPGASEGVAWGPYEPAIRRWERGLGRSAPPPTEPGLTGNPRLSAHFVEWLMGLPAGWVTDVPGVSRNEMLKALGNGVVPRQCAEATRRLLTDEEVMAA